MSAQVEIEIERSKKLLELLSGFERKTLSLSLQANDYAVSTKL